MVLTALSLVLGGKADSSLVRQGKDRLVASATFVIGKEIANKVIEHGGAVDEDQLILTRTMGSDGRSRAAVGGISVPASVLSSLSDSLIEIHAQAANMSITKPSKQREILDLFGGDEISKAIHGYGMAFDSYHLMRRKLHDLRQNSAEREKEIESLREFENAFGRVKPKSGEMDALAQEISRLSSVEVLRTAVGESAGLLDDEESGTLLHISRVIRHLESVQEKDTSIAEILGIVKDASYLLSDAAQGIHRYLEDLGVDPVRLESALTRRAEITSLLKNFSNPGDPDEQIADLIQRYQLVAETIADLTGGEERLTELEIEMDMQFKNLLAKAENLSHLRSKSGQRLSTMVTGEIKALAMPHTSFICRVNSPDYGGEISPSILTSTGADDISMLLQGHLDGPEVPLAKGASGGEMSRVMLALEVVLASTQPVGTYIFDEVDAGVGGKAAIEVGKRLFELSRHAQVIVVTHLAQVAAWADSHFVIHKNSDGTVSQSDVFEVRSESRIEEIARMLAGHGDSKSAREHAAELLSMRDGKNS
jgi:DNA repair protein RecN (Recombination protein N)